MIVVHGERSYCTCLLDAMPSLGECLTDAWKFEARDCTSTTATRAASALLPKGGAAGSAARLPSPVTVTAACGPHLPFSTDGAWRLCGLWSRVGLFSLCLGF